MATPPRSTTAAVGERSQPGPRVMIGIGAGARLENDNSDDENMAAVLEISHSTGLRRRSRSQPRPTAPPSPTPLRRHLSLPDLRELTEAPETDTAALFEPLALPPVRPSTPPSPVGLASTPRTTLAAVGEKSPGERSRPSTPLSVRPSTPPSLVGLASTPRTTLAAVGEKSPGERSRPGLSSGDVNHNTVDVKPNLVVRVEDVKPLALTIKAIKCSSGIYKLIKTSRTITALEGLRLASNQVITQLEYDLDLVYERGLVQLVMDKDVTAPLVKAKEMCYILPFLAFSFATVANKKARI